MSAVFTQSQLEAIAAELGHTEEGLSGSEIGHLLRSSRLNDPSPDLTVIIQTPTPKIHKVV